MQIAVGAWSSAATSDIAVSGAGQVVIYDAQGRQIKNPWYPFGSAYRKTVSVALRRHQLAVGSGRGRSAEVLLYSRQGKLTKRFYPYGSAYRGGVSVALGDVNADGTTEVITASQSTRTTVRTFTLSGKQQSQFTVTGLFAGYNLAIGASDNDQDGHDEILVMSKGS